MTTQEKLAAVLAHESVTTKRYAALQIGERIRQGDIYITRVPADHPRGKPWGSRQVAVGDTVGSRHVAVGDVDVFAGVPDAIKALTPSWGDEERTACCGPVVVARSTWNLEHPEHPHHELAHEDGEVACYQVTYQWNAQQRAAVRD